MGRPVVIPKYGQLYKNLYRDYLKFYNTNLSRLQD